MPCGTLDIRRQRASAIEVERAACRRRRSGGAVSKKGRGEAEVGKNPPAAARALDGRDEGQPPGTAQAGEDVDGKGAPERVGPGPVALPWYRPPRECGLRQSALEPARRSAILGRSSHPQLGNAGFCKAPFIVESWEGGLTKERSRLPCLGHERRGRVVPLYRAWYWEPQTRLTSGWYAAAGFSRAVASDRSDFLSRVVELLSRQTRAFASSVVRLSTPMWSLWSVSISTLSLPWIDCRGPSSFWRGRFAASGPIAPSLKAGCRGEAAIRFAADHGVIREGAPKEGREARWNGIR